ncbi:nitric oxide reductase activation protein NorD [Desulfosediminicola ganghwensis]|uniref:nitric oxide reductase activation protein NorD n=1 Tax=Desulfosediminicola ganghwensis TaxID=2569540 RepID=UPI0010AC100E|nr:VWA domain-containing protein [Desulfosediminicola ganghwensis]
MYLQQLKDQFYREVSPSQPQEWEVEEALEPMLELDAFQQQALLSHVHAVWPVSQSLCVSYIQYGVQHIDRLGTNLSEWVRQCLGRYEEDGLRGSRLFMSEIEENFYARLTGLDGAYFEQIRGRLQHFIRGVSGVDFQLEPLPVGGRAWTDGETIYLPRKISYFPEQSDNNRFYNFLVCCQWGYVRLGVLGSELGKSYCNSTSVTADQLENLLDDYDQPEVAGNIYQFLEFTRVLAMLARDLPGLCRLVRPLLQYLVHSSQYHSALVARGIYYSRLLALVSDRTDVVVGGGTAGYPGSHQETIEQLPAYYEKIQEEVRAGSVDDWQMFADFTGVLKFDKVQDYVLRRRSEQKQVFVDQLAAVIRKHLLEKEQNSAESDMAGGSSTDAADSGRLAVSVAQSTDDNNTGQVLSINNESMELSAEILEIMASISNDIGHVPEGYVQAAAGIAGRAVFTRGGEQLGESLTDNTGTVHLYDEWDFRRQGYRKNWCSLVEKEIQPVTSKFIRNTKERYRGLMLQLRRQFEMLRAEHRFVRRRRYGDDIDFDALVEARGDQRAGIAPSERLFIRLLRDDRDIAVMFLVDMSNSTEGWVGNAIKESLVLLSDVLEVVGDRYAIYGFSGMRRSRCELFRIKEMDETYGADVEQRICGVSPREYTRMAPAIRHLTNLLADTDARVRLLITLTDGKPEDYDGYRGEYAIEDTRQALNEARGKGVHTFSITVDRTAHSYLSHMCGRHNSIFVEKVEQLPARLPEIYRLMTS